MTSLDNTDISYTDKEITATFGDAYDHPQIHEGYPGDGDDEQPYRFVKNWSLWGSPASGSNNPLALPDGYFDGKKYTNAQLEGFVVPPEENSHYDAIKIRLRLTASDYISVDRSKRYRGFWVNIENGSLYWLHEPDESIVVHAAAAAAAGANKSQAMVHFDHMAWLAILSNLMDAVFTFNGGATWANESVADVFEQLQTTSGAANHDNSSSKPPFDKDLLVQYKDKIIPHLLNAQDYLTSGCKFIKSLKSIKPPRNAKDRRNRRQIQESTNAALERSQQHPWGEPKSPIHVHHQQEHQQQEGQVHYSFLRGESDVEADDAIVDNAVNRTKRKRKKHSEDPPETAGEAAAKPLKRVKTMESQKQSIAIKSNIRTSSLEENGVEKKKTKKKKKDADDEVVDGVESLTCSHKRRKPHPVAAPVRLETPVFEENHMREALQRCNDFLDPRPSTVDVDASSWTRVQRHEFCLKDETCAKNILKVSSAWEIDKKPEWCLLVVEAFRLSCIREHDNVIKKMFSNEKNASMIFNDWRIFAMNALRERNSMKGTPELFLLIAIVGIIGDCKFIDSEKRLHIISSRGVDWQVIVNEVIKFIEETGCRSKKLRKACRAAQKRIRDIKAASTNVIGDTSAVAAVTEKTRQPSSGPTSAQRVPATATRTATVEHAEQGRSRATSVQQLEDPADTKVNTKISKEDTNAAINVAVSKKNAEDEKRRQHEEDEKEKRRQRILQLTSRPATAENAASSTSNPSVVESTAAKSGSARQDDDLAPSLTTTLNINSAPGEGSESVGHAPERPANDPNLEDTKPPSTKSSRKTQPWKSKVYRKWDITTMDPPLYFVAHYGSAEIRKQDRQQQDQGWKDHANGLNSQQEYGRYSYYARGAPLNDKNSRQGPDRNGRPGDRNSQQQYDGYYDSRNDQSPHRRQQFPPSAIGPQNARSGGRGMDRGRHG